MTTDPLLDKYSAELVEELLNNSSKEGGELWFTIIRRKMKRAMEAMGITDENENQLEAQRTHELRTENRSRHIRRRSAGA